MSKTVDTIVWSNENTESTHDIEHPLYIKYDYANEDDYLNVSLMKVSDDDTYLEVMIEETNGMVAYSLDTGIYNYSGTDINRILGREEYESNAEEFNDALLKVKGLAEDHLIDAEATE